MKRLTFYLIVAAGLLCGNLIASASNRTSGEGINKIPPGERPPVEWHNLSSDAIVQGKIYVKFMPEMTSVLTSETITSRGSEPVLTGHGELDALNMQFGVTRYKSMLSGLYQTSPESLTYIGRHQQNGLHLWYELSVASQEDMLSVSEAFNQLPEVEIAEPVLVKVRIEPVSITPLEDDAGSNLRWSPNDQFYDLQWGFKNTGQDIRGTFGTPGADIKAEAAWDINKGNPEVIVAVIDGGIQYNHPDLAANIWPGIGPDGTNTTADDHGTHVAGTVAAVSNNGIGVAGTAGGDGTSGTGVKVMSLDIFGGSHGMNNLQLNIYAADNGAALTQNSWGYRNAGVYNQVDLDGIDYFNAYGGGDILDGGLSIFAAGNSNSNGQWYPAYYSGTVAVASTDNKDIKSSFSNYGTWIDLAAPGTDIASTASGSSYVWMSGTSMACPHVSGVAALVLSYVPGVMTNQQLWNLLKSSADNIDATNPNFVGQLGTGRLNALNALQAAEVYLSGVKPPTSLSANALSNDEIEIQWEKNDRNDAVLLAWSPNGVFGAPTDGVTYAAGQSIPGGGIVLYFGGSQTNVSHAGLNYATTYYYRAWSNGGAEYSSHKSAQATTPCPSAWDLPFTENFNNSTGVPQCWATSGSSSWNVGTFSNGLTGTSGNYAYVEITGNAARNAILISPNFDFSNVSDVRLEFKHRYNNDRSSATVSYSANGGSSWTTLQSWSSNTGNATFNQVINALSGQTNVKFRWELNFGGGGPPSGRRSWSIDDVSVTGTITGVSYTISATAGSGGSITPSGNVNVNEGSNQTFNISPNTGYNIADVTVNGTSVGAVSSYTFYNVTSNQSIHAAFEAIPVINYTITASAGVGGSITPSGAITVNEGSNQSFSIAANSGYQISDVIVDGQSIGAVSVYTFNNVIADHTIHATFVEAPLVYFTVTASAGYGGNIDPSGGVSVLQGDNQSFSISANSGYQIADVFVNGSSVGAVSVYTFTNVQSDQSIAASFSEIPDDPCMISTLPYTQDFNAQASVPECWSTVINTGDVSWQVGSFAGGLNGTTGNYAYFFYQGNQARNADLISAPFDFTGYTGINLTFKHYHVASRSSVGLYYSLDGGNSWSTIQTWSSNTSNPATFNQTLPVLAGQSNVLFRWNMNYNGGGPPSSSRSWSIDDVVVTGTQSQQTSIGNVPISPLSDIRNEDNLQLDCYPNPAVNNLNVVLNNDIENGVLIITDMMGRQLHHVQISNLKRDEVLQTNIEQLSKGLYVIKVVANDAVATQIISKK